MNKILCKQQRRRKWRYYITTFLFLFFSVAEQQHHQASACFLCPPLVVPRKSRTSDTGGLLLSPHHRPTSRRQHCCLDHHHHQPFLLLRRHYSTCLQSSVAATESIATNDDEDIISKQQDDNKDTIVYDAIIIGSGMSGLVAGNYLASKGHKVLMVESHSIPGGYTTNFFRRGFRFEVSTHIINGCSPEGTVGKILSQFDLSDKIDFVKLQSLLRWIDPSRGIDAVLPLGIDAYVDNLCTLYPHEESGIREFYSTYYPLAEFVVEYEKRRGLNQLMYVLGKIPILFRLLSLRGKTAADILDVHVSDPACKEIMTVMTALFGLHYSQLDAAIFVMGSMMFHTSGGAYYPIGGSGKLSKVLAKRFKEYGGNLRLKTHVDEIKFGDADGDGVHAVGVQMTDGKMGNNPTTVVERAKCVINCSDLLTMVNRFCPDEGVLPNHYVKSVQKRVPGNSLVVAWAGLDIDLREEKYGGITDFEIIRTNNKSEEMMRDTGMIDDIMAGANYSDLPVSGVTIYSNIDSSCCPPGKSVISTNFMASYDVFARTLVSPDGEDHHQSRKEYHALKDRVQEQLLDQMVKATGISDLAEHVEVMEVATPITFQRYTDNLGGSFMGWKLTPDQGAFSSFTPRTPIRNLFTCGQWLGVGGVASVMTTGLDAGKLADRYLDRLDKEETATAVFPPEANLSPRSTTGAVGGAS